jgi:hypothetical protein
MALYGYGGSSSYGSQPGQVQLPSNIYQQIQQQAPGVTGLTSKAVSNIAQEEAGQLPSDVAQNIQDYGAAWGISSGMPGSGIAHNLTLKDLGLTSLQEQQQGFGNYLNFLGGFGATQTPQQLGYESNLQNVMNAAAPNPSAVAGAELQAQQRAQYPNFDPYSLGPGTSQMGGGAYFTPSLY